jgi:hypothetical protein
VIENIDKTIMYLKHIYKKKTKALKYRKENEVLNKIK